MASRVRQNGIMAASRANMKSENIKSKLAAKSLGTRTALGNINNVAGANKATHNAKKLVAKKDTRTTRAMAKSKVTSSLHSLAKSPQPKFGVVPQLCPRLPSSVEDIDKDDSDTQLCSEYVKEIYEYMHYLEREFKVDDYMENQEINLRMRTILIDWLVQVHLRFHLLQETLFLTVQLIDRYLSLHAVSKNNLQLVGVTAMFMASKYEEMYPPEINDFVYITDNAYTQRQIRNTECLMLKALDYNLGKPLCLHFLRRNSKAAGVDAQQHTLAKFLMELTLPDYQFVTYDPSQIAAAALYTSLTLLEDTVEWDDKMTYYSRYSKDQLAPIVSALAALIIGSESSKYQAVRTKFSSSKFMKISTISQLKPTVVQKRLLNKL